MISYLMCMLHVAVRLMRSYPVGTAGNRKQRQGVRWYGKLPQGARMTSLDISGLFHYKKGIPGLGGLVRVAARLSALLLRYSGSHAQFRETL